MAFATDGRLFVCEQGGRLRVIKDGALLSTPFVTLTVNSSGSAASSGSRSTGFRPEPVRLRLLLGAAHPSTTASAASPRTRRASAGSEVVILDLDNLSGATNHNGGALAFGPDGKLYAAVGENANVPMPRSLANLLGKMLRLNSDGTIPDDNPFFDTPSGGIARSGRSACATRSRSRSTRTARRCSSTTSGRTRGRDQRRPRGRQLRLARYRGPDQRSRIVVASLCVQRLGRCCAITGGVFYLAVERAIPADYAGDYFSLTLRRLDSPARSQRRQRRHQLRQRHRIAGRSEGQRRRPPVRPRAWIGATTGVVYRIDYGAGAPAITTQRRAEPSPSRRRLPSA